MPPLLFNASPQVPKVHGWKRSTLASNHSCATSGTSTKSPRLCWSPVHKSSVGLTVADIPKIVKVVLKGMRSCWWSEMKILMYLVREFTEKHYTTDMVTFHHCDRDWIYLWWILCLSLPPCEHLTKNI